MANCPNCGSDHIQLRKDSDVSWGRAVAGWALFGAVGGAVGAVTGEDRHANACLDCGTTWKAADLHKSLKLFQKLIRMELDLQYERDRNCLNEFISRFSSNFREIEEIKKEKRNWFQRQRIPVVRGKDVAMDVQAPFYFYLQEQQLLVFGVFYL